MENNTKFTIVFDKKKIQERLEQEMQAFCSPRTRCNDPYLFIEYLDRNTEFFEMYY